MAQVGNEHRILHRSTRPDYAGDAVLLLALVLTVTHVVGTLTWLVALVMHVPLPVCAVSRVDGTQDRGHRAWWERVGAVPHVGHPAQRSTRPWGHGSRAKGVAADVGNDANHDHVHVHEPYYPEQARKEAR